MSPSARRTLLLILLAGAVGIVLALVLSGTITLDEFKARREEIQALIFAQPVARTALFILIFALAAAIAPGAAVFKLITGALFGLWAGLAIAVAATVLAACIGFLIARYLLRRWVERRWADRFCAINRGVENEGIVYLLAMRFNPLVPFFLINFGMGITRMRLWAFALTSLVGVMPASFIYANAGTQIAAIERPSDILSLPLLLSLLLLSAMPFAGRWAALRLRIWWNRGRDAPGAMR
jgi:uncharacterized membrane protein YdjX (TVP38/TMEM64 family)